ncbi:unnamed protein product [Enterobius vermicularis]|uniref:Uncharacterized protein n=1 Tax=Enterobius vermicularis TaxID=51028 RepID=A0A0N4VKG3_ENTVE|nr:unnamed protein product [Enterobius vermicularis]
MLKLQKGKKLKKNDDENHNTVEAFENLELLIVNEALAKIVKLKPELIADDDRKNGYSEVRKTVGNLLLDPDDIAEKVLKDDDCITVCKYF